MVDLSNLADPRCPPGWYPKLNVAATDPTAAFMAALALEHTIALLLRPGTLFEDRRHRSGCRVEPWGFTCYRRKKGGRRARNRR